MGTGKSMNWVVGLLLVVSFIFTNTAYSSDKTLRVPLQSKRVEDALGRVTEKDEAPKRATGAVGLFKTVATASFGITHRPGIRGNWKLRPFKDEEAARAKAREFKAELADIGDRADITIFVEDKWMRAIAEEWDGSNISVGVQSFHFDPTGNIQQQIEDAVNNRAKVAMIRHSMHAQPDPKVLPGVAPLTNEGANKINTAILKDGRLKLQYIIPVDEDPDPSISLSEKEPFFKEQINDGVNIGLAGISREQLSNMIITVEPMRDISTKAGDGVIDPMTKVNLPKVIMLTRLLNEAISKKFGSAAGIDTGYGASAGPDTSEILLAQENVHNILPGGKSLEVNDFKAIIVNGIKGKEASTVAGEKLASNDTLTLTGRRLFDALERTEAGRQAVVMATNIRSPLSLEGLIEGAMETESVVIFQQAKSELGYTWENGKGHEPENAHRFAEEVREAAGKLGFSDYVIKADHVTVTVNKEFLADKDSQNKIVLLFDEILSEKDNLARSDRFMAAFNDAEFMSNPNTVSAMKAIKEAYNLVTAEVDAGMTIFALDASFMPMRLNTRITAFLAGLIPENCSIEAEVGEIGGANNSTVADALEFLTGSRYKEEILERDEKGNILYAELVLENGKPIELARDKGLLDYGVKIDKIALNNGTAHGNNYDAQGNLIKTQMNLRMTTAIAEAIAPVGIKIVQHGITGTPLKNLPALRAAGITEGHVGTEWQNAIWDVLVEEAATGNIEAKELVNSMIDMLISNYGPKYKVTDKASAMPADLRVLKISDVNYKSDLKQLIGKELKNTLGAHKARMLALPDSMKNKINAVTKESAVAHFNAFGSAGTARLVRQYVNIPNPPRLMGGRNVNDIASDLANTKLIGEASNILKEELIEHNAQGTLADFLANLSESDLSPLGLDQRGVIAGIKIVLSEIGLNQVENERDIIVLPGSKINEMDNMQILNGFLVSPSVKGKAVVIVSDNEESLSIIRNKFLADTGRDLEKLVWLRVLKDTNLEPLEAIYSQFGLDTQCSLEKVPNKVLADAIKRGV